MKATNALAEPSSLFIKVGESSRTVNPFSTRYVRPGTIPYCFPTEDNAQRLVERLSRSGWRGAIVGPHGSGKSTLLDGLIGPIEQRGRPVRMIALHDGQRALPSDFLCGVSVEPSGLAIVDGFEQLGWFARRKLLARCRRSGWGLLVTAHREGGLLGLPVIYRTMVDLATVQHLVDSVLPFSNGLIRSDDVRAAFAAASGNVRETFFSLYDLFEQRRRGC